MRTHAKATHGLNRSPAIAHIRKRSQEKNNLIWSAIATSRAILSSPAGSRDRVSFVVDCVKSNREPMHTDSRSLPKDAEKSLSIAV